MPAPHPPGFRQQAVELGAHRRRNHATSSHASHGSHVPGVAVPPPFGHTRPQWIVPYGGTMTIDGARRTMWADYS